MWLARFQNKVCYLPQECFVVLVAFDDFIHDGLDLGGLIVSIDLGRRPVVAS